jgi:hypothetical protein
MYCFVVSFDMIPENVVEGDKCLIVKVKILPNRSPSQFS